MIVSCFSAATVQLLRYRLRVGRELDLTRVSYLFQGSTKKEEWNNGTGQNNGYNTGP